MWILCLEEMNADATPFDGQFPHTILNPQK
jgi:hypothetical protein